MLLSFSPELFIMNYCSPGIWSLRLNIHLLCHRFSCTQALGEGGAHPSCLGVKAVTPLDKLPVYRSKQEGPRAWDQTPDSEKISGWLFMTHPPNYMFDKANGVHFVFC